MSDLLLSKDDLEALTGKVRPSAQRRQLNALGIPYRVRADGKLVVFTSDCGATPMPARKREKTPDFAALRRVL